jgi:SAM-dependent methyltransferase
MEEIRDQRVGALECVLCGGLEHRAIYNEWGIDVVQCRRCHHIFSSFSANPHYDGFWGEEVARDDHFYWNEARVKMHRDFFERFVAGRSGRLLDVGCGLGFFLKGIASYSKWEAYGCEISPAAVRYARDVLGLPRVLSGRLEDTDLPQSSFDLITLWDVLEHFLYPDALLRRCYALLKEGGSCFIHTPNVQVQLARAKMVKVLRGMRADVTYLQARDHLHLFSMSSIRRLLENVGFSRVEFMHLHPVQSISGSQSILLRGVENVWFEAARALSVVSRGHLNFDNLFVLARKDPHKGC